MAAILEASARRVPAAGPELVAERARAFGDPSQTLVFGANTYRLMQRFHAESSDPGSSPLDEARKIVISRTIEAPLTWRNSTLVAENALDVVPHLKADSPVPLRCHGSIRMNRALLAAGLADRLEVMVFPVITGESGRNPVLAGLPTSTWNSSTPALSMAASSSWCTSREAPGGTSGA